jgi:general secretion pathway protein M
LTSFMKDRRVVIFFSGLTVFVILFVIGLNLLSADKKALKNLKDQKQGMMTLKDELLTLQQKIQATESRKNLTAVQGVVQAIDDVFVPVGLKDRVKTVKSTGKREGRDGFEEEADVYIEKVTMNEMVNILYRIENAPMILTIKKITIKKSFENPELLNISLILSFLKTK